jgi:serine/threonine protein kinase
VLVAEGGLTVGLTDFGLSRTKAQLGMTTSTGGLKGVGTVPYMAPELFEVDDDGDPKHKSSKATDVYAFGMTAFCILIGQCGLNGPYPDEDENGDDFKVRKAVKAGKRPCDYVPWPDGVPEKMKELLSLCWDQDEKKRPAMNEVVEVIAGEKSINLVADSTIRDTDVKTLQSSREKAPEVFPTNADELVTLMKSEKVKHWESAEMIRMIEAISLLEGDEKIEAFINADGVAALSRLLREKAVWDNVNVVYYISGELCSIAENDVGNKACIDAEVPSVLILMAREKVVMENINSVRGIAIALRSIAESDVGKDVCIDSGAVSALTVLLETMKSMTGRGREDALVKFVLLLVPWQSVMLENRHVLMLELSLY